MVFPETPVFYNPSLPPSSSLLVYLYAGQVLPTARWGTKAPLGKTRVESAHLACVLFAVAFWQLREAGLVSLELVQQRHLLRTNTSLRVSRTSVGEAGQHDGIEGGLLDVLTPGAWSQRTPAGEAVPPWLKGWADKQQQAIGELARRYNRPLPLRPTPEAVPETVTAAVGRWFGRSVSHPERVPITWTQGEGVAKGYLTLADAHRHPLLALLLGKTICVPESDRIAALEPPFSALLGRWQAFAAQESALAEQLNREVVAGIKLRRSTAESSSAH